MNIQQAREFAKRLNAAADAAEAAGKSEIDLISELQSADDIARADLQAAIDAAQKK